MNPVVPYHLGILRHYRFLFQIFWFLASDEHVGPCLNSKGSILCGKMIVKWYINLRKTIMKAQLSEGMSPRSEALGLVI